jgi:hypothetical protein
MITAESTSSRIVLTIENSSSDSFRLERAYYKDRAWHTWTSDGWIANTESPVALEVAAGDFVDSADLENGLWEYRIVDSSVDVPTGDMYEYSKWVKFGESSSGAAIGYSFGNYSAPKGSWGTPVTPDDLRYTYLWGTDFKATNGQAFTDAQTQYFIDAAITELERELNICIKKRVIKCNAEKRNLVKTTKDVPGDYDEEEPPYRYKQEEIVSRGIITTRRRPLIKVTKCDLVNIGKTPRDLLPSAYLEKEKGVINFTKRPWRIGDTSVNVAKVLFPYGEKTFRNYLYYEIDYEAGYESSDDIPDDLRQIVGKLAAISLLNIIGDGLMSGFSSSSLSMDGISESFSSTQSATSAYFGARIAVYQKEVENYIKDNKYKFRHFPIRSI